MPNYGIANRTNPQLGPDDASPAMREWAKGLPFGAIECHVNRSTDQVIPAGAALTYIIFNNVVKDTGNFVGDLSATVTSNKITIPPTAGGLYVVSSKVPVAWTVAGGVAYIVHTNLKGILEYVFNFAYVMPNETVQLGVSLAAGATLVAAGLPFRTPTLSIARVAL